MRLTAETAAGYKVWEDERSKIIKRVLWVEDLGKVKRYAVLSDPMKVDADGNVKEVVVFANAIKVFHQQKLIVINPRAGMDEAMAKSLVETLG